MIRALSTAVSGLRTHQFRMDAVGHNIANVNTYGYKGMRVRFQDLMSQILRGATSPGVRGGVNPLQIGLGVQVAANIANHAPGSIKATDRVTDMAIEGNGFFIVSDGRQNFYTRDGSFGRDAHGYLVNANGMHLMGWAGDRYDPVNPIRPSDELQAVHIPLGEQMVANASTRAVFAGNLDARAAIGEREDIYIYDHFIYDSLGRRYDTEYEFERTGVNTWDYRVGIYDDLAENNGFLVMPKRYVTGYDPATGDPIYATGNPAVVGADPVTIEFSDPGMPSQPLQVDVVGSDIVVTLGTNVLGEITSTYRDIQLAIANSADASNLINVKIADQQLRQTVAVAHAGPQALISNGVTGSLQFGDSGAINIGMSNILDLAFSPTGAEPVVVDLNLERLTQLAGVSNALVREQDGYPAGELAYFNVAMNGDIIAAYTNGLVRPIGAVATATFINPEGLSRNAGNIYTPSANSGDPNVGFASEGGRGVIRSAALEMSNVDLAFEFTEMITTSRGFQANTRVVTASDEILVEVLNMRR